MARYPKSFSFSWWPSAKSAVPPVCPVSVLDVAYPARTAAAIAAYETTPAHPPPPTAWYLPFHPEAGSQTSALMSESLVGVSVARTRQNAGTFANGFAAAPRPAPLAPAPASSPRAGAGGAKAPAATGSAPSILACGSAIDARFSQAVDAAAIGAAAAPAADAGSCRIADPARTTAKTVAPASFMRLPPSVRVIA